MWSRLMRIYTDYFKTLNNYYNLILGHFEFLIT